MSAFSPPPPCSFYGFVRPGAGREGSARSIGFAAAAPLPSRADTPLVVVVKRTEWAGGSNCGRPRPIGDVHSAARRRVLSVFFFFFRNVRNVVYDLVKHSTS